MGYDMDQKNKIYQKYFKLNMIVEILQEAVLLESFQTDFDSDNLIENLIYSLCNNTYSNKYLLYRRIDEQRLSLSEFLGIKTDIVGLNKLLVLDINSNHSGLNIGDIICKVNHNSALSYLNLSELNDLVLDIMRYDNHKGSYISQEIRVNVKKINFNNFENRINIKSNYIKIETFNNLALIKSYIESIKGEIVFDFRNNMGGKIENAIEFLEMLIPRNTIMFYEKKKNELISFLSNSKITYEFDKIIILVNELTASSAEIVVFALQKYLKVEVIGSTDHTFGKECFQKSYNFDDESCLLVPTGIIYTPDKTPMNQHSIKIDKILSNSEIDVQYI